MSESPVRDAFTVAHAIPGRLRLKLQDRRSIADLYRAADAVLALPRVTRLQVSALSRSVAIEYRSRPDQHEAILAVHMKQAAPGDHDLQVALQESEVMSASTGAVWARLMDLSSVSPLPGGPFEGPAGESEGPFAWGIAVDSFMSAFEVVERRPESLLLLSIKTPLSLSVSVRLSSMATARTEVRATVLQYVDASGPGQSLLFSAVEPEVRRQLRGYLERLQMRLAEAPEV